MMQVARLKNAWWMSSRRSRRMRRRFMPLVPGDRSLYHPPEDPEAGAVGLSAAGDVRFDAAGRHGAAVLVEQDRAQHLPVVQPAATGPTRIAYHRLGQQRHDTLPQPVCDDPRRLLPLPHR
jgi:hypothetical protein